MYFMAVKKSRKRSSFVLYSYFNDSAFTEIRRYVYFYNKFEKKVLFSIEGIRKGYYSGTSINGTSSEPWQRAPWMEVMLGLVDN